VCVYDYVSENCVRLPLMLWSVLCEAAAAVEQHGLDIFPVFSHSLAYNDYTFSLTACSFCSRRRLKGNRIFEFPPHRFHSAVSSIPFMYSRYSNRKQTHTHTHNQNTASFIVNQLHQESRNPLSCSNIISGSIIILHHHPHQIV
jgi:hypothetical protein